MPHDPMAPRVQPVVPTLVPSTLPERLQRLLARGKMQIAQPFVGVTTDSEATPGLFARAPTGMSLQPLVDAAIRLLASLDPGQRQRIAFPIESELWRCWSNLHPFMMRHGLCLEELADEQRAAALALLEASLGARGFKTVRNIMKLNQHLRDLTGRPEEYGEWYYWLSLFGTPSMAEPWGWQIDGHHLIVNCVAVGDQMILTPNFLGSEPVRALSGPNAGLRVFAAEEGGGLRLIRALAPDQKERAIIGEDLPRDVFGSAFCDNAVIPFAGIRYGELSNLQRRLLTELLRIYLERIPPGHARITYGEVQRHLADTHFAWIGDHDEDSTFYYRVYSPVILIEFSHQPGQALGDDRPSRNHIHTVMRTPNGNDYGRELLRQHHAQPAGEGRPPRSPT